MGDNEQPRSPTGTKSAPNKPKHFALRPKLFAIKCLRDQFWIDHMVEKHECFHCDMLTENIAVGDETVELLVPHFAA